VDIANASGGLVTGTDLAPLYNIMYNEALVGPIRQHSASWGRTGTGYTDRDAFSDAWLWKRKDFCDIFAAGNSGPTYRSINHPANAKNIIAVGAVQNGTTSNAIASFSSRGPTVDLRIKPTVCTPGQGIMSVDGAGTTGYKSLDGTSMATPACNASAGLIRQYLKQGFYPSGVANPADSFSYISAVLIRAMLIVSADPNVGSYVVPDSNIGFGRVDVDSVLYFSGDKRRLALWDDTLGVATGAYREFQIQVNDTTQPLRAAFVWWDTAAAIGANPALVNNLDFQITNAQGTFYGATRCRAGCQPPIPERTIPGTSRRSSASTYPAAAFGRSGSRARASLIPGRTSRSRLPAVFHRSSASTMEPRSNPAPVLIACAPCLIRSLTIRRSITRYPAGPKSA